MDKMEREYRALLRMAVGDLVYWLHEITVLPDHRKDWARGKVRLCRFGIKDSKLMLQEIRNFHEQTN